MNVESSSHESVDIKHAGNTGQPMQDERKEQKKLPFWRVLLSVIQASFGVQTDANKARDFEQGSIMGFVAAALIFTFAFIMALVLIVSLVLP